MGDSAEFEKLSALETRLASALDRIAKGVAARGGRGAAGSDVLGSAMARAEAAEAAKEEAEARARDLSERVGALEGRLGEAQEALAAAEATASGAAEGDTRRIAELESALAAREAALAEAAAAREALEVRVGELEAAATEGASEQAARTAELEKEINILKRRVERARQERDEAMEARDSAQDIADELSESAGADPDDRVLELRAELRRLRSAVDDMSRELDDLRAGRLPEDGGGINRALEAQVAALTEARRAEAAELDRILVELDALDGTSQEGAGYA